MKTLLRAARETELIGTLERYSLKAVNILPIEAGKALAALNAKFEVANRPASEQGFQFRTEFSSGELTTIIELIANANVTVEGQVKSGLLIGVESSPRRKRSTERRKKWGRSPRLASAYI